MLHTCAKWLFPITFIIICNGSLAQTSSVSNPNSERENNPYSKYGIGELWNGNSTTLKGMANITSAYQDPYTVNSDNPASYSSLLLTTFDGGLSASTRTISAASGSSYTTGTATIGYLNIGIPVNKNCGLSLGLRPIAKTYYALVDTTFTPLGQTVRSYSGAGSLSYAYVGAAYKFKGLSVGFNFGYLFGNYQSYTTVNSIDTGALKRSNEAEFTKNNQIGGIYWKAGFTYEHLLNDSDYVLRFGGTFTLDQNLRQHTNLYQISSYNFGDTLANDTSYQSGDRRGKLHLPLSYSLGVMLCRNDRWQLGIDYSATNWNKFNSAVDSEMNYGIAPKSYKVAVGGSFTPNPNDPLSYFSRVNLRLGFYYGTDYVNISNTTLPVYGFTFGGSFPYKRSLRSHSRLSASFDIGKMGTISNNLLQQTYFRFGFGLTFNEKWFIPRKYD